MASEHVQEIAKKVGGVVALSLGLGLSRGAVSQWTRVPAERIAGVARLTGLPRHEIRPDIFPAPSDEQKVEAA